MGAVACCERPRLATIGVDAPSSLQTAPFKADELRATPDDRLTFKAVETEASLDGELPIEAKDESEESIVVLPDLPLRTSALDRNISGTRHHRRALSTAVVPLRNEAGALTTAAPPPPPLPPPNTPANAGDTTTAIDLEATLSGAVVKPRVRRAHTAFNCT